MLELGVGPVCGEEMATRLSGFRVQIEGWLPFSEDSEGQGVSLTQQP